MKPQAQASLLSNKWIWIAITLGAVLLASVSHGILRNGIFAIADTWAFWEGSVSILENGKYEYFGGQPIVLWPPLYALYLAAFQSVLGVSGHSVIIATICLTTFSFFSWSFYAVYLAKRLQAGATSSTLPPLIISLIFIFVLLASSQIGLVSNSLQLALVPFSLVLTLRLTSATATKNRWITTALLASLYVVMLLSHNSSIIFVAGSVATLSLTSSWAIKQRLYGCAALCFFSIAPWAAVRWALGLGGHQIGMWGSGKFSTVQYLMQVPEGLARMFAPASYPNFGWVASAMLIAYVSYVGLKAAGSFLRSAKINDDSNATSLSVFAFWVISILAQFAIHNVVFLDATLADERFIWYLILGLVPFVILISWNHQPLLSWLLAISFLIAPAYRTVRDLKNGAVDQPYDEVYRHNIIRHEYFITTKSISGPLPFDNAIFFPPPNYPWLERSKGVIK